MGQGPWGRDESMVTHALHVSSTCIELTTISLDSQVSWEGCQAGMTILSAQMWELGVQSDL